MYCIVQLLEVPASLLRVVVVVDSTRHSDALLDGAVVCDEYEQHYDIH